MKKLLTFLAAASIAAPVFAQNCAKDGTDAKCAIDVNSVVVEEVAIPQSKKGGLPNPGVNENTGSEDNSQTQTQTPSFNFDEANQTIDMLDRIVNLAEKVINIIKEGQPVVDISTNYANAIPQGITHWTQMQGWSSPEVKGYRITMKNLYGIKVADIVYQVHYTYGGNVGGKGHFLTGVTVEPVSVSTAWGYTLNMTAEVPDSTIANVGSSADPIAAMQLQLKYKVHTIIKDMQGKDIFYIRGDGQFKRLA